jgi:hypothetical protein
VVDDLEPAPEGAYLDFAAEVMSALEDAEARASEDGRELEPADLRGAGERWRPDTEDKAGWLCRLFLELQAEEGRIKASYKAKLSAVQSNQRRLAAAFAVALDEYLTARLASCRRKTKPKSERFWGGVLGHRTRPEGPTVTDEKAATAWAEEHDDLADPKMGKLVYVLSKTGLKERVAATGEVVPGVVFREESETLYVVSDLRTADGKRAAKSLNITDLAALRLPRWGEDNEEDETLGEDEA